MTKLLTVQNAEINTASITIRTLQVEGKQVTMGVFRQLPVEDIIVVGDPPTLQGVGWGHVNYLLDDYRGWREERYGKHINLVWQKGSELRRCVLHQRDEPVPADLVRTSPYASAEEKAEANKTNVRELERARLRRLWCEQRNALVAPLFDLPQLFIAV